MPFPGLSTNPASRQRGSVLVPAAFAILLGLILLWGAQLGYAMYLKRELQKTADLAALTGAQVLERDLGLNESCSAAAAAATAAIKANMASATLDTQPQCWNWDSSSGSAVYTAPTSSAGNANNANAMQVTLSTAVPALFPYSGGVSSVHAQATAVRNGAPVAAFSIGSTLAQVPTSGSSLLMGALSTLGLNLSGTSLDAYDGLTNVSVTPSGLLQALGITVPANVTTGQLNSLLDTRVSVSSLLNAVIQSSSLGSAEQSSLLSSNVALLQALQTQTGLDIGDTMVNLGGAASGVFADIATSDPDSVLNAQVSALSIISTAIGVATAGHAISLSAPISLPLGLSIQSQLTVISPPSIGIGGPGTTASTAQERLYIQIATNPDPMSITLPLLGTIALHVNLPLVIELANGTATMESMCQSRDSEGRDLANLTVTPSIGSVCLGNPTSGSWSTATSTCTEDANTQSGLQATNLLSVTYNGESVASLTIKGLALQVLATTYPNVPFYAGQAQTFAVNAGTSLSQTISNILQALPAALIGNGLSSAPSPTSPMTSAQATAAAAQIWQQAKTATGCTGNLDGLFQAACRSEVASESATLMQNEYAAATSGSGLGGVAGALIGGVSTVAGDLLTGNVPALLTSGLPGLVGSITSGLSSLLGCSLLGTEASCEAQVASALKSPATSGSSGPSQILVDLLGTLWSPLNGIFNASLNSLGTVVSDLFTNVLGISIGNDDVTLMYLNCTGRGVQLVQ